MSIELFLTQENQILLWDVIKDEDVFNNMSNESVESVLQVFNNNIRGFFDAEKKKTTNLLELNKKYIVKIISFIHATQTDTKNILHTHVDIQKDKRSQFDNELSVKQNEFTSAMALPVPPTPKFNDNLDEPMSEMEDAIKKMTEQRNYDIEQINRNYNNSGSWLKPKETSIKNEKLQPKPKQILNENIRLIKIDNAIDDSVYKKDVIELNASPTIKKQISWMDEKENVDDIQTNIFKKLKTVSNERVREPTNDQISALQNEVRQLHVKVEDMYQNINEILQLLKK
jgi:hypothetical protein